MCVQCESIVHTTQASGPISWISSTWPDDSALDPSPPLLDELVRASSIIRSNLLRYGTRPVDQTTSYYISGPGPGIELCDSSTFTSVCQAANGNLKCRPKISSTVQGELNSSLNRAGVESLIRNS
jgi:hypothetical protein